MHVALSHCVGAWLGVGEAVRPPDLGLVRAGSSPWTLSPRRSRLRRRRFPRHHSSTAAANRNPRPATLVRAGARAPSTPGPIQRLAQGTRAGSWAGSLVSHLLDARQQAQAGQQSGRPRAFAESCAARRARHSQAPSYGTAAGATCRLRAAGRRWGWLPVSSLWLALLIRLRSQRQARGACPPRRRAANNAGCRCRCRCR